MLTKEEANKMIAWEEEIETEMYGKGTSWAFIFKEKILQKWQEEGLVEKDKKDEILDLATAIQLFNSHDREEDTQKLAYLVVKYFQENK